MDRRYNIGITLGDYNGVSAEVIIKTLEDERIFRFASVVIYGQRSILSHYVKLLKVQNFNMQEVPDTTELNPKIPNVINCWSEHAPVNPGEVTAEAGARALICLNAGIKDLAAGNIDLLITGPLNKSTIAQHHPDFKGQTEYISKELGSENSMMMLVDDNFRVGLVTNHTFVKRRDGKN